MSALGQKQTSGHVRVMSALPPKADIGPKADISETRQVVVFFRPIHEVIS
jgi:hypothetical protein